jgi:spore maturation protein CgeB
MMDTPKITRVLYVGLKYDYGQPERGLSYEYVHFLETLRRMAGIVVDFFPFDEVMREVGRKRMNARLLHAVHKAKPDVCFFVLFTDEIEKATIRTITNESGAITLNWFGDDHWRFSTFSRFFAREFQWVLTTDSLAVTKYQELGCNRVIKTQWGVNHHLYKRFELPQEFDVTFVGQVHSQRERIIDQLQRAGIHVQCWGKGWESGRLGQDEMIRTYSRSKISLNFTESSIGFRWKPIAKTFLTRRADDSIRLNSPRELMSSFSALFDKHRQQIKGRNFEIPGAGGFLLTSHADNLEEYFVPGKEIATFQNVEDLIEKIGYYLSHDDERERIRKAGHERALREHTYEHRFQGIFETISDEKA